MIRPLLPALAELRGHLVDADALVRAVASGRQKGRGADGHPQWRRVELRYVDLKAGRHLQVTSYDDAQAHTANHSIEDVDAAVDALLAEPFGNWHVETTTQTHQLRVTKQLEAALHTSDRAEVVTPDRGHDRDKERLLDPEDPLLAELGLADAQGCIKPSRQAKYRQVEEFLRILDASVGEAIRGGRLRRPTAADPLRVVDLGCGNAYLTLAAQRFLSHVRGLPVRLTGVDVKEQSREHSSAVAGRLGLDAEFVVGSIADVELSTTPEVVLALHACDTATDEALARAVGWDAGLVLAAPCCHHDIAAQLRRAPTPLPYGEVVRHGILRERLADTLTDSLRASLMRAHGYRVDVMAFVESQHTPRNTLLRAVRGAGRRETRGGEQAEQAQAEYDELVRAWSLEPRLAQLLGS